VANTAQAKKRVRQNAKRQSHNSSQRSAVRTAIKKVLKLISTDVNAANTEYRQVVKLLDIAASHQVIHKNKAARLKSRLAARLKAAANA
jgi:small subunit ribosomal protein S20